MTYKNALENGTRGVYNNASEVDLKAKRDWDTWEACLKNGFSEFVISYDSAPCVVEAFSLSETFECKEDSKEMLLASGRSLGLLLDKSTCANCSVVTSC